jgi:hypothetical protein
MATDPRILIERMEAGVSLPAGSRERFSGYGVMGLPFRSAHVLAMRRFMASSIGPAYTAVWHRDPGGEWVFYADVPPRQACARFFGAIVAGTIQTDIRVAWPAPHRMHVTMPAVPFEWDMEVTATPATQLMNLAGRLLPEFAWRSPSVLATMGLMAGPLLGVGRVRLQGRVPNGQHFVANPRVMWVAADSQARLKGESFGPPGPVEPQARLGDFWIPQRGMLVIGESFFDPFDPARHSPQTTRMPGGAGGGA